MGTLRQFAKGASPLLGAMGVFDKPESTTVTQVPMITDEQQEAMKLLLDFGKTGKTPSGYVAGEDFDTSGFDFGKTGIESEATNRLLRLLTGGSPEGIGTARDALTRLATSGMDFDDPDSEFGAFKRRLAREVGEASDVIDREAAITGDRFGTRIIGEKGDLAARQGDLISEKLGALFRDTQDRTLQAALGLGGLESTADAIEQSRLSLGFEAGGLDRTLKNAKAQLNFDEFMRKRKEKLASLSGLETVFNRNIPFGIKSSTYTPQSTFSKLLNFGLQAGGTALGAMVGGPASVGLR
ncbi:MAG: hypothetical protein DRJ03_03515 [Chloroflexi bacterium]|nr:MAG: hypothetical protein DRJ03_03515 [Chloroflexota bacterium]